MNIHPEPVRLKKQFALAEKMGAPVVMLVGPDEIENNQVALKHMATGRQITVSRDEVVNKLDAWLRA